MRSLFLALLAASTLHAEWKVVESAPEITLPGGARFVQTQVSDDSRMVKISAVFFQESKACFRVVDNPERKRLAEMTEGAIAGVNGSYFHEDFSPLGLMISDGRSVHDFQKAKLLSGILAVRGAGIEIVRSERFKNGKDVTQAIQAGPFLVEDGAAIAGLNSEKSARRTVVATNGRGGWAILLMTPIPLSGAAEILATGGIFGDWTVKKALNLDGGSSSGLWVNSAPEPHYLAEFGIVRNFLLIVPR